MGLSDIGLRQLSGSLGPPPPTQKTMREFGLKWNPSYGFPLIPRIDLGIGFYMAYVVSAVLRVAPRIQNCSPFRSKSCFSLQE